MASSDEPAILKHLAKQEEQRKIEREKKRAASKYAYSSPLQNKKKHSKIL